MTPEIVTPFRKSSHSGQNGDCVEVAATRTVEQAVSPFRKSSHSDQEGDCVEVAATATAGRAVRDSKDPGGPLLHFTGPAWAAFLDHARRPSA